MALEDRDVARSALRQGAGGLMEVHTHCGQSFRVRNSRNSRVARSLRNKIFEKPCPRCRIPAWKVEKFNDTAFV
ncbi:MAG: pyrrolysine--tRNA(Pyl) ligase small subunit [Thermoleophilia bacterium]|nr:pyrrolysine--tRNA(Pyl) ligase small subunit [Thermoleophilia bacterium]